MNGILVYIVGNTHRVKCAKCGVVTAAVPWAYPGSSFTKDFDNAVAWLVRYLPKTAIAEYMRITWRTVGRCVSRVLNDLEPDRSRRFDNLRYIGIDETSYKKGHKYITVIVNHETNTVIWAAPGHGKEVLKQFFRLLTPEQLASIEVITGDGAQWITNRVDQFIHDSDRCVDSFHVVEWAMEALDEVRREAWREAHKEAEKVAEEHPRKVGRPRSDDEGAAMIKAAKDKSDEIKNSAYALGKAPEHLTEQQRVKIEMIAGSDKRLYRAYCLKESLRLLLKLTDPDEAEEELDHWLWRASHSRIPAFKKLYQRIKKHKENILNTIRLGMSNARVEAINNKIKLISKKAYGFRNVDNMIDLILLICSDLEIPLPNR